METLEEEVRSLRAATIAPKVEHPSPVLGGPLELGSSFYQSVPLSPPQFLQRTLEFPDEELEEVKVIALTWNDAIEKGGLEGSKDLGKEDEEFIDIGYP